MIAWRTIVSAALSLALAAPIFGQNREAQPGAEAKRLRVLCYSNTAYYRHPEVPALNRFLVLLGAKHGIDVDVSEHFKDLRPKELAQYDVLLLNNANQLVDVIPEPQRKSVESWFKNGGGIVALHASLVKNEGWEWLTNLGGCDFDSDSEFLPAKILVDPENKDHPAVAGAPAEFVYSADWTNHTRSVTGLPGFKGLMRVDESSYEPVREYFQKRDGKAMGKDHPICWTNEPPGEGKFFYTELGHDVRSLDTEFGRRHVVEALRWAAVSSDANADPASGGNWPRLRGPAGNGLPAGGDNPNLPETWSKTENVAWKADVPGLGWSSPVVWGGKVFLTTVVNDKAAENVSPRAGLYLGTGRRGVPSGTHHWLVYCFDLNNGKLIWRKEAHTGNPPAGRHPKSTYAAETPVTDGERLYVLFGDVGMFCYDLDGKLLWKHDIEAKKTMFDYGAAASPVVHGDQVFYVYDNHESSYIAALDTKTGGEKWRKPRDEKSTWASPFVWKTESRAEIVVSGKKKIRSYDPQGNVIWELAGKMSNLVIPSPFVADGLLYVTSGYFADRNRPVYAIKPGAEGDISLADGETANAFVRWYQPKGGPYNTSPVVYRGIYYLLLDQGMMSAYDAKSGEQLYDRVRFPAKASFTSSPWANNGKIFCLAENGTAYVLEAGDKFEIIGENDLGDMCMACPAIVGDRLLIRTQSTLYCIKKQ